MLIIPAIDLMDGRCVRLLHGDFDKVTLYGDPAEQLAEFESAGAEWAHIVDLEGARSGARRQSRLIGRLASTASVKLQCGGGVRSRDDVLALFDVGAARVVVGSMAARKPEEVRCWIEDFGPEKICCAFDVRPAVAGRYFAAVGGWAEDSGVSLASLLACYPSGELRHVLVTDISRDGALSGPNAGLISTIIASRPDLSVQASGGVSSLSDLRALRKAGAAGAIVGRALYEKKFTLEAARGC